MLYIVAVGLLLVYGVLRIINLAHGAFLALGAYAAVVTTWWGWTPWAAPPLAFLVGAGLAALIEWRVLRELYSRPLDTILATWGLNIIVVQAITVYFGREIQFATSPIERAVHVGAATYSEYRLVLLLLAAALGVLVWLVVQRTSIGVVARAVIMNEELASRSASTRASSASSRSAWAPGWPPSPARCSRRWSACTRTSASRG